MNIAGTGSFCPNLHVVVGAKLSPWITTVVPPQVGPDVGPTLSIVEGALAMARSPAPLSPPPDDPSPSSLVGERTLFPSSSRITVFAGSMFDAILSGRLHTMVLLSWTVPGTKPRSTPRLQYTFAPG